MTTRWIKACLWWLPLVVGLLSGAALGADQQDERLLEGLRQRRLFELAELYCRQQLSSSQLPPARHALLVTELIRTYAQQALHAPPDERAALWEAARQAARDFQQQQVGHPRLILVRVQDALAVLARAELERLEGELTGQSAAIEQAREHIREATRLLEQLDQELAQQIAERHRRRPQGAELTAQELQVLQSHVGHQLARAYRSQALSYDEGTDDRIAALLNSSQQLERVLTQVEPSEPLAWEVRIDQAVIWRLLTQWDRADAAIELLAAATAPAAVQLRGRAEAIRVALARQQWQEVAQLLDEKVASAHETEPELDLAQLEASLALSTAASQRDDQAQARQWQQRAVALAEQLERQHGPFWGRRGQLLLVRSLPAGMTESNLQVLAHAADHLYVRGQHDEALAAYDKAAALAQEQGQVENVFTLRYKAALVQQQRGAHSDAIDRLRRLAIAVPTNSQANRVHLQAIGLAAELVRQSDEQMELYRQLLEEHVATWPGASTADQASLWLGRLRQFEEDWTGAAAAYQQVSMGNDHFAAAVEAAGVCWLEALAALQAAGQPLSPALDNALAFFDAVLANDRTVADKPAGAAARQAALAAARLRLGFAEEQLAAAQQTLQQLLARDDQAPVAWRRQAQGLLVLVLARQPGDASAAQQMLSQLTDGSAEQLLEILAELTTMSSARSRAELVPLRLTMAEHLWARRDAMPSEKQQQLALLRAAALADGGRRADALALYRQLAEQQPDSPAVQQAYARLLSDSRDSDELQQALDQWRLIAHYSPPQSSDWYEAKYQVALLQFQLGRNEEAAQLIRYLDATGALDGIAEREKFEQLLRRAEQ